MNKRSKNREEKPDCNDIVNDIELEVETQQVEQDIVNRLSELKQLSSAIDKAITAVINATLALESAIRQTHHEEGKLGETVLIISNKVDSINQNIDKVLDDAPTKLKVSVTVSDVDWQKINKLFAENGLLMRTESVSEKSMICLRRNARMFKNVIRNMTAVTLDTMYSGSFGSSSYWDLVCLLEL